MPGADYELLNRMPSVQARSQYLKRLTLLRTERASWIAHWKDCTDYVMPWMGRFTPSHRNKGQKKHQNIVNNVATRSVRTLSAGMMSGITSPANPWFKLRTENSDLMQTPDVKEWCDEAEEVLRTIFDKSNWYDTLAEVYDALAVPGTAAMVIDEDDKDVIRCYCVPVGQYLLAQSGRCEIDTMYREISLSVAQTVDMFGLDACSSYVQNAHKRGAYDLWIYVVHAIEPNREMDQIKDDYQGMAWRSVWFELGAYSGSTGFDTYDIGYSGEPLAFLRKRGYRDFPVCAPRWSTTGMEDVYGHSPTMDALGDIRALQLYEKRKAQAVDKTVNPPMRAPTSMRTLRGSLLPGDTTYVDTIQGGQTYEPAMTINPNAIEAAQQETKVLEMRIGATYYADLWLAISEIDSGKMTAEEVRERKQEKMLMLGPVLEKVHGELLDPGIRRTFSIAYRRGLLPPPPPALRGQDLAIEFVSIMAQAQKALGVTSIQSLVSFTTGLAQIRPDAPDNLDVDAAVEEYANLIGVKPSLVLTEEKVQQIRQQRAQAQQQQAAAEQAATLAKAGKDASQADTTGDNGLTRYLSSLGGPAAIAGGGNA